MAEDPNRPDDPDWGDLVFDEEFVRAAPVAEPSAEERRRRAESESRSRQLQTRLASEDVGFEPLQDEMPVRRRRPRIAAVAVLVVVALVATGTYLDRVTTRREAAEPTWSAASDGRSAVTTVGTERPTPQPAQSAEPLGAAPAAPSQSGPFEFVRMRPRGVGPVTYDPCRPIPYVVNTDGAPAGADALIEEAIDRVSDTTGLVFDYEGPTDEVPVEGRGSFQPDRYGDRWAPVVIWWATPDSYPPLAGDVAGAAGSTSVELDDPVHGRTATFLTGTVALDGPQLAEIRDRESAAAARSVILHELGHLVGLDHVDDPTQIMNPEGSGEVTDFAAGDLRGLAELGQGPCIASL